MVSRGEVKRTEKRRKIFGQQRRSKADREKEENIWSIEEKRKREGRGGKYLEKEHILSADEMQNPPPPPPPSSLPNVAPPVAPTVH